MHLVYKPLNAEKNEIRLLEITPDQNKQSPVRGSLRVVSLDDKKLEFDALSYIWGESSERKRMLVDDVGIEVPTNLESAICRLRGLESNLMVWADFVCINQDDESEKSWQINLMGRIYSDATHVIAWIGELNPDLEQAVGYAEALQGRFSSRNDYWKNLRNKKLLSEKEAHEREMAVLSAFKGILDLFKRPYWFRLWTFQEWHLSKPVNITLCGDLTFNGPTLFNAAADIAKEEEDIVDKLPSISLDLDERTATHIRKIKELDNSIKEHYAAIREYFPMDLALANGARLFDYGLHTLLELTCHRACTKPHDRVYALLGMVRELPPLYPPDYNKPVESVMHEATAYIIKYDEDPCVFNYFNFFEYTPNSPHPSWALNFGGDYRTVDWQRQLRNDQDQLQYMKPEEALWEEGFLPCVKNNLTTLQLWGRSVGKCSKIESFPLEGQGLFEFLRDRISHPEDKRGLSSLLDDLESTQSRLTATWLSYLDPQRKYPLERFIRIVESAERAERVEAWKLMMDNFSRLSGRCCFHITNHWGDGFGIGDNSFASGDIVIVASGIYQPIILRKDLDCEKYRIVGKAFVDGIAERQKSNPTSLVEGLKKEPLKRFLIR